MIDRRHRVLTDDDVNKISSTYHAWRGEMQGYEDVKGLCRSVKFEEVKDQNWVLTPGRYVGSEEKEDDMEEFEEKMHRLTAELSEHLKKSKELEDEIRKNLGGIGWQI